jgi:hypothetical protein
MSFQHFYGLADDRLVPSRLASVDEELYRPVIPGARVRQAGEGGTGRPAQREGTTQWWS